MSMLTSASDSARSPKSAEGQTPPLSKGERTRQKILTTAFDLFAENGYQAVSIRDIAANVGVTHVTLLHHFDSKEQLLSELMVHRDALERESAEEFFGESHDADDRYRGLHSPVLRWFMHRLATNESELGAVPLFLKITTEAIDSEHPAHQHFIIRYAFLRERLIDAFSEELSLRDDDAVEIDPVVATEHFIAIADGLQFQSIYNADTHPTVDSVWRYLRLLGVTRAEAVK